MLKDTVSIADYANFKLHRTDEDTIERINLEGMAFLDNLTKDALMRIRELVQSDDSFGACAAAEAMTDISAYISKRFCLDVSFDADTDDPMPALIV
jgi:hypothetical protein